MTFQQLRYIVEISKCGSINMAAHRLFLSQSGISASVGELERELGIQIFHRNNRGVEVTPEGKEFCSYALSLLEQKHRIEALYGKGHNASETLSFSVSTQRYPFTEDAFLQLLEQTAENRFHFTLKEEDMESVIDDVFDHRADLGIIFLTELTEKIILHLLLSRDMDFHEVAAVQPCIYIRQGHPLSKQKQITEHDLSSYPYVSFDQDQGIPTDFSEEYRSVSMDRPTKCISVNNRSTMMNVLTYTDAFTTGTGLLTERSSPTSVVTIPLAGKNAIRLGWIAPLNSKLSHLAESFIALLEDSVHHSIQYTTNLQLSKTESASPQKIRLT